MPLTEMLGKTALDAAIGLVRTHLAEASKVEQANVMACLGYIRAAQVAIRGLEQEVDEILIESKSVARAYWSLERRDALLVRIETYLHVDRLRHLLDEAMRGIDKCHDFAVRDAQAFFLGSPIKRDAVSALLETLTSLQGFLRSLNAIVTLDPVNYAGPSGINMLVLLDIDKVLENADGLSEDDQRRTLVDLATAGQGDRARRGLAVAADAARTIQELTVAFRLSAP